MAETECAVHFEAPGKDLARRALAIKINWEHWHAALNRRYASGVCFKVGGETYGAKRRKWRAWWLEYVAVENSPAGHSFRVTGEKV